LADHDERADLELQLFGDGGVFLEVFDRLVLTRVDRLENLGLFLNLREFLEVKALGIDAASKEPGPIKVGWRGLAARVEKLRGRGIQSPTSHPIERMKQLGLARAHRLGQNGRLELGFGPGLIEKRPVAEGLGC
jgi:hypothetical protein